MVSAAVSVYPGGGGTLSGNAGDQQRIGVLYPGSGMEDSGGRAADCKKGSSFDCFSDGALSPDPSLQQIYLGRDEFAGASLADSLAAY